jgi:hypothetical protein
MPDIAEDISQAPLSDAHLAAYMRRHFNNLTTSVVRAATETTASAANADSIRDRAFDALRDEIRSYPPEIQILVTESEARINAFSADNFDKHKKSIGKGAHVAGFYAPVGMTQDNPLRYLAGSINLPMDVADGHAKGIAKHELIHRLDQFLMGDDSRFMSQTSPAWQRAIDATMGQFRQNVSLGLDAPSGAAPLAYAKNPLYEFEDRSIPQHLGLYKPEQYSKEAFAEMGRHYIGVWQEHHGDPAAVDRLLGERYPELWDVYKKEFIPKMQGEAQGLIKKRENAIKSIVDNSIELADARGEPMTAAQAEAIRKKCEGQVTSDLKYQADTISGELDHFDTRVRLSERNPRLVSEDGVVQKYVDARRLDRLARENPDISLIDIKQKFGPLQPGEQANLQSYVKDAERIIASQGPRGRAAVYDSAIRLEASADQIAGFVDAHKSLTKAEISLRTGLSPDYIPAGQVDGQFNLKGTLDRFDTLLAQPGGLNGVRNETLRLWNPADNLAALKSGIVPAPPIAQAPTPDIKEWQVGSLEWQDMYSPRSGAVFRADAAELDPAQRATALEQLRAKGIDGSIVKSSTFKKEFIEIPAADFGKLQPLAILDFVGTLPVEQVGLAGKDSSALRDAMLNPHDSVINRRMAEAAALPTASVTAPTLPVDPKVLPLDKAPPSLIAQPPASSLEIKAPITEPTVPLETPRGPILKSAATGLGSALFAYGDVSGIISDYRHGETLAAEKKTVVLGAGMAGGAIGGTLGALPPVGIVLGAAIGGKAGWDAGYGVTNATLNKADDLANAAGNKLDSLTGGYLSSAGRAFDDKTGGWASYIAGGTKYLVGGAIRNGVAATTSIAGGVGLGALGALPPVGATLGGITGGAIATDGAKLAMGDKGQSATAQLFGSPISFAYGTAKGMTVDNAHAMLYDVGADVSVPEGRIPDKAAAAAVAAPVPALPTKSAMAGFEKMKGRGLPTRILKTENAVIAANDTKVSAEPAIVSTQDTLVQTNVTSDPVSKTVAKKPPTFTQSLTA